MLSDADIEESTARVIAMDRGLVDRVDDFFAENPTDDTALFRSRRGEDRVGRSRLDLIDQARANTERWQQAFLGAAGFGADRDLLAGPAHLIDGRHAPPRSRHT